MTDEIVFSYEPQPRQSLMHGTACRQIFYGGAAGGGKSHAMRWDQINFCMQNPGLQAYLFRRSLRELETTHIQRIQLDIPPSLGKYSEQRKAMEFNTGSVVHMCYCERDADVYRYLSEEMHHVAIDEAGQMTEFMINMIRGRNRLGGFQPNPDYAHALPRMLLGSNPGGPGHNFLKRTFIAPAPPETAFYDPVMRNRKNPADKGWSSIYIPARMDDNKYLDPDYAGSFGGLPPELAKAYTEGDWDAIVGKALHTLSRDRHGLRPFKPPAHWTKFMSIDWGSATPFSVGWYCVSDGAVLKPGRGQPERWLPAGAVIRYAEYYGWDGNENKGARLDSPAVARTIVAAERARGEVMDFRVGDYQMWAAGDGPSTAARMMHAEPTMAMRKSRKDRKANYAEALARLAGNPEYMADGTEEQHPMFFCTADCVHFWRTVPTLVLDDNDPDKGPDTKLEDHVYDEWVYALRAQPYMTTEEDRWEAENRKYLREIQSQDPYATVTQH